MSLKQESLFIFLATVTVWCDIFPFGQKLGNKYNKAKIEQEKNVELLCYLVAEGWGWCFIFFPAVVWRRRKKKSALVEMEMCVCIQGSLIHNQLLWARCTAPRVPDGGRGRGRGRAGAELQPELALRPDSLFLPVLLSLSLSLPLSSARSR